MEFAQLLHYTVVAAEMNFSRAADKLGITQPSLSRSIQNLEKSLGVQLLQRKDKRFVLTPAGSVFLAEAKATLEQASLARNLAQRMSKGDTGRIRIGMVPSSHARGVPQCIKAFHREQPELELSFEYMSNSAQPAALLSGDIDLGFFHPLDQNMDRLCTRTLGRTHYVAAIPSDWRQAKLKRLRLADLADCPFVVRNVDEPSLMAKKMAACRAAGFAPRIVQYTNDPDCLRSLVSCEVGVAFVANPGILQPCEGVTYKPISDLPEYLNVEFVMAWVARGESGPLKALIGKMEALAPVQSLVASTSESRIGASRGKRRIADRGAVVQHA